MKGETLKHAWMSSREGEGGVGVSRESGVKWDHRPSSFKLRHLLLTQFDRQRERERERGQMGPGTTLGSRLPFLREGRR